MRNGVIYFSLNNQRKHRFIKYVKNNRLCYCPKYSFDFVGERVKFKDPRDLLGLIDQYEDKSSLHIIIDYLSCCEADKIRNYAEVMRDIIMAYPEVQFLFDETFVRRHSECSFCFINFLFLNGLIENGKVDDTNVLCEFHTFDLGNDEDAAKRQFMLLVKGRNNTFDASNLRHAIKARKFKDLHVEDNFKKLDNSRRDHAAVVVEEEYHQNMFNSYCIYANGYRVFPVTTASELEWLNQIEDGKSLVIRDYDLQFIDEKEDSDQAPVAEKQWNEIDRIRGAKFNRENNEYKLSQQEHNKYWSSFMNKHIYFVSKGSDRIVMRLNNSKKRQSMVVVKNGKKLCLNGIRKPLEGIFVSMQQIKEVKNRFKASRYRRGDEDYKIVIDRIGNDGHSCPLDIYDIARLMIGRAEVYSREERYRTAALVAGEAMEILNGFHVSLMKTAYFIQAVAENAMAISLLGGNENVLSEDVSFRLRKVKEDVVRLVPMREDQLNVLYNIFNDCRLYCREKEYFEAADHALSIMMLEKEGLDFISPIKEGVLCVCRKMFSKK